MKTRALLLVTLAASLAAETHQFQARSYSLVFTASGEPALRVKPGDTVETTTVDSNGDDETGKHVAPVWNALTGPFYVDGAEPGDTLVVHLERVRLNSRRGAASSRMADEADTVRDLLGSRFSGRGYHWTFDTGSMTGSTGLSPRLARYKLPLAPFPGCVGVAPAWGESLSALTAGPHGGNLDYNRLVEGTTLYFPVNVRGGWFFIGDGHAAQGDGEPNGGAVETTLAVRFRVDLRPKQKIPSVRAETKDFYAALGIGDPLDQAFQRATANMIHWLTGEFQLTREEAHVLIGTSARYDIGAVVNPRGKTVACRISRQALSQLLQP
ncbi:MAG: acetamidase/formamidase family protein [Bryobacterales bacterium]|nr:acetamidase/formamidase family protein [Bryobacterales bacterium]